MLFRYRGFDKNKRTKSGFIRAEDRQDAIYQLKAEKDIIVVTALKKTIDNEPLNSVRSTVNNRVQSANESFAKRTEKMQESKTKKERTKADKQRANLYLKTEKTPVQSFQGIRNLVGMLKTMKTGKKIHKKKSAVSNEETILNKEAYYELMNMFKEREEEFGDLGQLTDSHVAPVKKAKVEETGIDWSLLEANENDIIRGDIEERFTVKVKQKDVMMLTRRLQIMLSSGVSLINGLKTLADDDDDGIRRMLEKMVEDIQMGYTFSEALSKFPKQFDNTYVSLVSIGETSGSLDDSLQDVVNVMQQKSRIQKQLKSAAIYPVIIGSVLGIVVILASIFFIPMFEEIFSDLDTGGGLPVLTTVVFNAAGYIPYLAAGTAVGIGLFTAIKKNNRSVQRAYSKFTSKMSLKLPVLKQVTNVYQMHTFASTVSLMLKNGVRLSNSLMLAQKATSNVYLKSEIATASVMMTNGYTLSEALSEQTYFDKILINIILIGEETGEMSFALNEIARFYSEELERRIENLMAMVQPLSIILIGVLAVPVVIAIYLPILDMSSGAGM